MPPTTMVALAMGSPCWSVTKPLMPRWTYAGKGNERSCVGQAGQLLAPCPAHPSTYLLHEGEQRLLVVLPLLLQLALVGELVAAQVDGELQAVGVQVAEVIQACKTNSQVPTQLLTHTFTWREHGVSKPMPYSVAPTYCQSGGATWPLARCPWHWSCPVCGSPRGRSRSW